MSFFDKVFEWLKNSDFTIWLPPNVDKNGNPKGEGWKPFGEPNSSKKSNSSKNPSREKK